MSDIDAILISDLKDHLKILGQKYISKIVAGPFIVITK